MDEGIVSRFRQLQSRLPEMYEHVFPDRLAYRAIVVVPSLTLDVEELAKIDGAHHYEERMLFMLMLLQMPRTELVYVTSQPICPTVIDYFLHLLPGIPSTHARRRLTMLSCLDASPLPLVRKILDRPRLIERIRASISHIESAHMSCFNSTQLESELATQLGIPLYACDPDHGCFGSKSGSREVFREAGIRMADGFENLVNKQDIVDALTKLKTRDPELRKAVVKLNEGFSGEGNAVLSLDECPPDGAREWIQTALPERIQFEAKGETWERFCHKFGEMSGIVETFVDGSEKRSPSAQCRINPVGEVEVISTHDQILGGPSHQVFLGCTFPADAEYRLEIQEAGRRVGEVLRDRGVMGRFGVDFVSVQKNGRWEHFAIEINLRKGGTTHPFAMLQFLTNGHYDAERGEFVVPGGDSRCYIASDNIHSDSFKGLSPDDLIDISVFHGLHFHSTIQQGVVFHLIGALSEFGKFGAVCIGDSQEHARAFYDQTLNALHNSV